MAAKKPKEVGPIPPDRFDKMSAGDRNTHLEALGREAMLGKAKWIERTGALGKQVEQYKAAKSQSERRDILRQMGAQVQNSWVAKNFKVKGTAKAPISVKDAFAAAKTELGRMRPTGGGRSDQEM
jgi:hypothetical protein